MVSTRLCRCAAIVAILSAGACGGDDDAAGPGASSPGSIDATTNGEGSAPSTVETVASTTPTASEATGSSADAEPAGEACSLLDEAFLDETFAGQTGTFGDPYQFTSGLPSPNGLTCTWNDASTGLSLRMTLEDIATAETDDHSGRAYNIDVEPVAEPQDGPGEKAVLLVDEGFDDLGGDGFPYGYFFVRDDVTVFVETVGLDIGADGLRALADEAAARLTES